MTKSKLGPIPDEHFQSDVTNMPNIDKEYSKPYHDRMKKLTERAQATRDKAAKEKSSAKES